MSFCYAPGGADSPNKGWLSAVPSQDSDVPSSSKPSLAHILGLEPMGGHLWLMHRGATHPPHLHQVLLQIPSASLLPSAPAPACAKDDVAVERTAFDLQQLPPSVMHFPASVSSPLPAQAFWLHSAKRAGVLKSSLQY